jgi:hypothetical protein
MEGMLKEFRAEYEWVHHRLEGLKTLIWRLTEEVSSPSHAGHLYQIHGAEQDMLTIMFKLLHNPQLLYDEWDDIHTTFNDIRKVIADVEKTWLDFNAQVKH